MLHPRPPRLPLEDILRHTRRKALPRCNPVPIPDSEPLPAPPHPEARKKPGIAVVIQPVQMSRHLLPAQAVRHPHRNRAPPLHHRPRQTPTPAPSQTQAPPPCRTPKTGGKKPKTPKSGSICTRGRCVTSPAAASNLPATRSGTKYGMASFHRSGSAAPARRCPSAAYSSAG
jgi:hypothetical protein